MAAMHANDAPEDLESALRQIQDLRQALAVSEERNRELARQNAQVVTHNPMSDSGLDWVLNWAIKQNCHRLLDDLAYFKSSPLGVEPLSTEARMTLTAKVVNRGCFRFLDLMPELRNRIYHVLAHEAFRVPWMVAYMRSQDYGEEALDNGAVEALLSHLKRRGDSSRCRNRLAMLRVSRQIHEESRQIFYCSMSLDLSDMYLPFTSKMMVDFIASPFRQKLQFVRHVELEANAAQYTLFNGNGSSSLEVWRDHWKENYNTPTFSFNSMNHIRTLLFNLEAVTIYKGSDYTSEEETPSIGLRIAVLLSRNGGNTLERLFPRLSDIVTVNDHGSERFRKTEPREWQLHYSREVIPSESRGYERSSEEMLVDTDTGLMHSATIANLADTGNDGSDDSNGSDEGWSSD
ncbi:hypothetical protein PRZ48_013182 [Zasmidium cellare]|uniref:Uncharacterized protein n=1 Tax=Zasmidium cellare TaxID=395010 RepID=A0ABR0E3L2_ZASCE|nr:hypothetical protein PRZ48_013182 [Zasmidium cellare]